MPPIILAERTPIHSFARAGHRHHKPWRAKPALRTMAIDHCLLNRSQIAVSSRTGQTFNRDNVTAVELKYEPNARIDRLIAHCAACSQPDQHRAASAIPFRADDFGARQAEPVAEKVAQAQKAIAAMNLAPLSIDKQHQMIADRHDDYRIWADALPGKHTERGAPATDRRLPLLYSMFARFVKDSPVTGSGLNLAATDKNMHSPPASPDLRHFDEAARRTLARCTELAHCTDSPSQLTRLFCSPSMQAAHEKLRGWMESARLDCRVDPAANLIGQLRARRDGASDAVAAPSLIIGSHLDTVVNAGKYDGTLGILMGLAMAELLVETKTQLPISLDIIAFSEEEGVRYQTPYIGSRAMIGDLPAGLLRKPDSQGVTMADALRAFGGNPDRLSEAVYPCEQAIAYIEPHIEQGPVLELEGLPVGIVSGITGQTRASFQFLGRAGHAGTVPMTARHDALAATARFIAAVEEFALTQPGLTATVGQLEVRPNVSNVIPGEVNLLLDVRHLDDETREAALRQITHYAAVIAEDREIEFDLSCVQHHSAVKCDDGLIKTIESSVLDAGVRPLRLPSGAGHDAVIMSRRSPVAMLFVRCDGGVSHHPEESVTEADIAVALDVLWRVIMKLAAQRRSIACK